jgi:phosphotransferase system enzyme I (PtsI)
MRIEAAPSDRPERVFSGLAVSPGIATGTAWLSESGQLTTPEYRLEAGQVEAELKRFADAVAGAIRQLKKLKAKTVGLPDSAAEELGYLLDARLQMLSGSRLVRGVQRRISEELSNAEAAVRDEIAGIIDGFAKMDDSYLAARADDIREVGDRLIRHLLATPYEAFKHLPAGSILIAEELTPSDTMLLDPASVGGIASVLGGMDSHTAIVARSLGIPAVLGVSGLIAGVEPGDIVIVDGGAGRVVINPTTETAQSYARRGEDLALDKLKLAALKHLPPVTLDGYTIQLRANLELPRDVAGALDAGAGGIGLLRTEFLFMNRATVPSEDEQYASLRDIVVGMAGRPVTVRTIDIGGDKLAPALRDQLGEPAGVSPNPALGVRGVRLSLAHTRLLETQLAAILRAAEHGPVQILLPLISCVDEIVAVREVAERVLRRLKRRRVPVPDGLPPIGIMIEVPGAALSADALATVSDFFSIGTNDLTMYTLAIDRDDERVAALYNPLHPAVLRLIQFTIEAGLRGGLPVTVCGEIAGDPRYTALLVGLGVRELSMSAASLPRVKQRIRALNLLEAARRARSIMDQWEPTRIAALLDDFNRGC